MKKWLVLICSSAAILSAVLAYYLSGYWQSLVLNVAAAFFAASLGIVLINVYLERNSRAGAVRSILMLSNKSIARFHNTFLDLVWTKFSSTDFGDLREKYIQANGDIMVISPDDREKIYILAKNKNDELSALVGELEQSLIEITSLIGWDLDVDLLESTLKARHYIRSYKAVSFDDSQDAKNRVAEYLIDIDTFSQFARIRLKKLCGIKEDA